MLIIQGSRRAFRKRPGTIAVTPDPEPEPDDPEPPPAVAERFTINMTGQTGVALALANPARYITCADDAGPVYVWFVVTGSATNTDPAPGGRGILVEMGVTDNADIIAGATGAEIDGDSKFSASSSGALVTVINSVAGARTDATAGTSSMTVTTTVQGA